MSDLELVAHGKTKLIYKLTDSTVKILSKDSISAGDGARKHEIKGKAIISNDTTCNVFEYLNQCKIPTHFIRRIDPLRNRIPQHLSVDFISQNCSSISFEALPCDMIPIECVCRRIAYGSFLKRHKEPFPVTEGFRFERPKIEFFYKDDSNHDPLVTEEQLLCNSIVTAEELSKIVTLTELVFLILERAWHQQNCVLVDMKIEFGRNKNRIVLSDVVDNDSWRVWPEGDKRLMKDKQVYRNLTDVSQDALSLVLKNYEWVQEATRKFAKPHLASKVVIYILSDLQEDTKVILEKLQQRLADLNVSSIKQHRIAGIRQLMDVFARLDSSTNTFAVVTGLSGSRIESTVAQCFVPCEELSETTWLRACQTLGMQDHVVWSTLICSTHFTE
eukprot:gene3668-8335_t